MSSSMLLRWMTSSPAGASIVVRSNLLWLATTSIAPWGAGPCSLRKTNEVGGPAVAAGAAVGAIDAAIVVATDAAAVTADVVVDDAGTEVVVDGAGTAAAVVVTAGPTVVVVAAASGVPLDEPHAPN